jgi:signal peptidase II
MRILWVSILVLALDQATKAAVVQLMHRGESIPLIGDWLKFTFTENPGMAFGIMAFPREATAVFSIIVTVLVLWYLYSVRSGYTPYIVSLALVLGGAVGNIIDRVFYGLILGYGDLFMGKVVDFIHVDVWRGYLPEALPLVGGAYLPLFPIWNVADMAIVCGVVGILVFQRRFHRLAFEQPEHDRARLRELEEEREHQLPSSSAAGGPATGAATQASTESSDVPPTAPSAESPGGAALDADDDTEDDRSPEKPAGGASDGASPNGDAASESAAPEPRDASSRTAEAPEAEDRSSSYAPPENSS